MKPNSIICLFFSMVSIVFSREAPVAPDIVPENYSQYRLLYEEVFEKILDANASLEKIELLNQDTDSRLALIKDEIDLLVEQKITFSEELDGLIEHQNLIETKLETTIKQLSLSKDRVVGLELDYSNAFEKGQVITVQIEKSERLLAETKNAINEAEIVLQTPHVPSWHYAEGYGWLWSSPEHYPFVYSMDRENWLYYEQGTQRPWVYYDYGKSSWEEWFSETE
jgi:hypothetical protein